jgi:hypothetical protein
MPADVLVQAWPFVHPGIAAAAAAAAAIPILIHLINRRRFRRVPWAAMAFLLAANRRSARRVRLENFLLLGLRMLIIAGAGLAVARPYFSNSALGFRSTRVDHYIVLDPSLSMNASRPDGHTRFQAAQDYGQRLVNSLPVDDGVAIVTTAHPAEALIESPTHDRRLVREVLAEVGPTQRADDMAGALTILQQMLSASDAPPGNKAVYVISDFAAHVWVGDGNQPTAAARLLAEIAPRIGDSAPNLTLVRIDPGSSDNLAVTDFRAEPGVISTQIPISLAVEVTNFGPSTARGVTLQLRDRSQTVRRETLPPIPAGGRSKAVYSVQLSERGSQLLEARVSAGGADALPLDDARWLAIEVRDVVPVLAVDGQPGSRLIEGQAGYLAMALSPPEDAQHSAMRWGRPGGNLYDVKVTSEPELLSEISHAYEVLSLCNVPRLSPAQWNAVSRFVADGGGLLVSGGGLLSTENYNRFGFADGKGVLPARLESVVEASSGGPRLGFELPSEAPSLFAEFADHHGSGLFSARVDRYLQTQSPSASAEVPLQYSDGRPAVILARFGQGQVALWTTTVNMEWNNLPGRGDFIPVMANLFGALTPRRGGHRNLTVGETLVEPLTPAESSLPIHVTGADGQSAQPTIAPMDLTLAARFGPTTVAGPLTLTAGESRREFAINTDPRESALTAAETSAVDTAVRRPLRWVSERDVPEIAVPGSVEWSATLLWVILGLLLLELWLAQRFAAPLPARQPVRAATRTPVPQRKVLEAVS